MLMGTGSPEREFHTDDVRDLLHRTFSDIRLEGQRVLVIIPDRTRTAPIPLFVRLLHEALGERVSHLDYLIGLGTHRPLDAEDVAALMGVRADEWAACYPRSTVYNHEWDRPDMLAAVGTISRAEMAELSGGLLRTETPVTLNRRILDYDHLIICGPVFPHEVAGFSGGAKYLFPGIAGPRIIDATHWLGALVTCMGTIGIQDTPVRRVIHRAAALVPRPITCIALVMRDTTLHGMYSGTYEEAFNAAATLSARLNIVWKPRLYQRVLSMPSARYDDLWTAAKAMYKTEPVIADGGEVIIYAPHLSEVSFVHGALIDYVGYHVRDYFLEQWERFRDIPGAILAHSTHVRGTGTYDREAGVERPRIRVTLATGIPEERCRRINLGYADWRALDPREWEGREDEGILCVHEAGEVLYRPGLTLA